MADTVVRIVGIDPGLNITGYGILDFALRRIHLVEAGVVRTKANQPLTQRLATLYEELLSVFLEFRPTTVAMPLPASRSRRGCGRSGAL